MKELAKYLIYVACFMAPYLATYLLVAFCLWDTDVSNYETRHRVGIIVTGTIIALASFLMSYIKINKINI